jgi:hypothetical protein
MYPIIEVRIILNKKTKEKRKKKKGRWDRRRVAGGRSRRQEVAERLV